jgi:hypothetical protein
MQRQGAIPITAMVNGPTVQIPVTPAATITLDLSKGNYARWTAGQSETIGLIGPQSPGQALTLMIANDSILPRTIAFGAGFKASASLVGVLGKTAVLQFVSDGSAMYEASRSSVL